MVALVLLLACDGGGGDGPADTHVGDTAGADTADPSGDTGVETGDSAPPDTGPPPGARDDDGDGWYAQGDGGRDCDDGDADVHPGAEEWCDPVDHDCDGEPLAAGVCGKEQDLRAMGRVLAYGVPTEETITVRDLTGDGVPDILHGGRNTEGIGVWSATDLGDPGMFPTDENLAVFVSYDVWSGGVLDLGDADGDGLNDLATIGTWSPVGVGVHYGPFTGTGEWREWSDADAWWSDGDPGWCWGCDAAPGDFDGDGLGDLALTVEDEAEPAERGGLWVFWGGAFGREHTQLDVDWAGGELANVGDLDGDGLPDVVATDPAVGMYQDFVFVSGGDLASLDGAPVLADVGFAEWREPEADTYGWTSLGDLDGDGYAEAGAFVVHHAHRDTGREIVLLSAPLSGSHSPASLTSSFLVPDEHYDVALLQRCEDTLGARTLSYYDGEVTTFFPAPEALPARATDLPERRLRLEGMSYTTGCDDVTGDGVGDLSFHALDEEALMVFPGWDVPWDEDAWW